jgi:cytidylate kinase
MNKITIAIDGPAGAGKSTISKIIASRLGIEYIDTGAMYRAVTLKAFRNKIGFGDKNALDSMLEKTAIEFKNKRLIMDGEDVSDEIRLPYVSENVSEVSAVPEVRLRLVELQRKMASSGGVIMDGRDIGTNVLKDAQLKVFLTASIEERAHRRYMELKDKGFDVSFEKICQDIEARDKYDSSRKVNPLCKAEDAVLLDSTNKSIDQVVDEIISMAKPLFVV